MKGGALRVVLGDQLSPRIAALDGLDRQADTVLLAEVADECGYVPHHPQKIALILAAMRHFAAALRSRGVSVRYVHLDDAANSGSLTGEVARAVDDIRPARIIATEPCEWRVRRMMENWGGAAGLPCEIREDGRFLCSSAAFREWAAGRKQLRMEFFYREMRRRYRILMDGDEPEGGRWNYDSENRKRLPADVAIPAARRSAPDETTRAVLDLVRRRFGNHYGSLEHFGFPVTASEAEAGAADFIDNRLAGFGDWQDAMAAGEPLLFHSLVSAPLNLGLLEPLDLCRRAEDAWRRGKVTLNAAEGFIRQILGWREFIRGIYWLHMPEYATRNALGADLPLPDFYWTGETDMRCIAETVGQTMRHAYAHHIQRLMVTGNFALIAGLDPDDVDRWYLAVYADAYEWVEMPNTRGMALHADGGIVGSKPYAASGAYINRMSDYCGGCAYDVKDAAGDRGCPFNALYWDFIARHEERFANNPRMAMPVRTWHRMAEAKRRAIRARAATLRRKLAEGEGF